jgi:hypothetical protein
MGDEPGLLASGWADFLLPFGWLLSPPLSLLRAWLANNRYGTAGV